MGDSLAQAALILVHLNLFSSTANWDLGLGRRTPLCVSVFFFKSFYSEFPGLRGGMFLIFGNVHSLRVSKKKKKSNIYKVREAKDHKRTFMIKHRQKC